MWSSCCGGTAPSKVGGRIDLSYLQGHGPNVTHNVWAYHGVVTVHLNGLKDGVHSRGDNENAGPWNTLVSISTTLPQLSTSSPARPENFIEGGVANNQAVNLLTDSSVHPGATATGNEEAHGIVGYGGGGYHHLVKSRYLNVVGGIVDVAEESVHCPRPVSVVYVFLLSPHRVKRIRWLSAQAGEAMALCALRLWL